jgi:hypothetical protein
VPRRSIRNFPAITGAHRQDHGDGLLAEFASVIDALRCAVEVQQAIAERNIGVAADNCIELRTGINVGDVVVEEGDIFGTASISPPASKAWRGPVAFAFRPAFRRMQPAASTLPSRISASRRLKTSRDQSLFIGCE